MTMYNLVEYSSNYSDMAKTLWLYSKDKTSNLSADIIDGNAFKPFNCKTKL